MVKKTTLRIAVMLCGAMLASIASAAPLPANIPASIDPGRVDLRPETMPTSVPAKTSVAPLKVQESNDPPVGSKNITFKLKSVKITGMHVFTDAQVEDIYQPFIGKKITLDKVWFMAGKLTERYQHAGYFLSRSYVPAQQIDGGHIELRVVEGYISEVTFNDPLKEHYVVQELLDQLKAEKPVTAPTLESVLLRMNDLPGVSVRAVLALPEDKHAPEGATRIDLVRVEKHDAGRVSVDNNGSRFLGPFEASAQYSAELIPLQKTSVSLLASTPTNELQYGSLRHEIPLFPGATVEGFVSYTSAYPGYTLEIQEIKSASLAAGVTFKYQWIRQRDENLTTSIGIDSRDTNSTILGSPLTQDAVRAIRSVVSYDNIDDYKGYNQITSTLSQGIKGLGSSEENDPNLSRAEATPDFEKIEMVISRLQSLGSNFNMFGAISGQWSTGPLYSSEEFGYGGQVFGRAYDASEITGDEGIAAAVELRYTGFDKVADFITPTPYIFYDLGTVWNYDNTQLDRASGSSAGLGFRTTSDIGIGTNLGLAFPLTRAVTTPMPGNNGKNPRLMFEMSYDF